MTFDFSTGFSNDLSDSSLPPNLHFASESPRSEASSPLFSPKALNEVLALEARIQLLLARRAALMKTLSGAPSVACDDDSDIGTDCSHFTRDSSSCCFDRVSARAGVDGVCAVDGSSCSQCLPACTRDACFEVSDWHGHVFGGNSLEGLPMFIPILKFLSSRDVVRLSRVSKAIRDKVLKRGSNHSRSMCASTANRSSSGSSKCCSVPKLLVFHFDDAETAMKQSLTYDEVEELLTSKIALDHVESLSVSLQNTSHTYLLAGLAAAALAAENNAINANKPLMPRLKRLHANIAVEGQSSSAAVLLENLFGCAAASTEDTEDFAPLQDCLVFGSNQLRELTLSGFQSIESVNRIIATQTDSLVRLTTDYFVRGHERELKGASCFGQMPNLRSLVFDVADDTDMDASLLLSWLSGLRDEGRFLERLYLPHIRICGDSQKILQVINAVFSLPSTSQVVIQFSHLPLSAQQTVDLRQRMLTRFPAVCIADHFIVAQSSWASWWTPLSKLWVNEDAITGLGVFREQIDFSSLGTSAVREWLKLSKEQKHYWNTAVAEQLKKLYRSSAATAATAAPAAVDRVTARGA